jgi:NAD(P)-dependent dehydrogenase (short-subunit alcohol dehydrogenase family)
VSPDHASLNKHEGPPTDRILLSEENLAEVYQDTQKSIDINLFGTMNAVFAFLPLVRKGQLKKVVAISSGMGDIGKYPHLFHHFTSLDSITYLHLGRFD